MGLRHCEADTHQHVHKDNNVLSPRAIALGQEQHPDGTKAPSISRLAPLHRVCSAVVPSQGGAQLCELFAGQQP